MLVSFGAGATLAALRPDVLQAVPQDAALLLGLALGLPHGAGDHLLVEPEERLRFIGAYALTVGVVLACWPLAPWPYTMAFLAMSAWHLGQGDMVGRTRSGWGPIASVTRGLVWVGLPLLGTHGEAWAVLEAMAQTSLHRPEGLALGIVVAHLGALGLGLERQHRARGLLEGGVLCAWMSWAPPLFAFATAFAVWHSLPHLRWMRESLQLPWTQLWRRLSLPTLVSAAGTVALFGGLEAHHALVAIAALTVPHALWVHRTFTSQPLVLSESYGAR